MHLAGAIAALALLAAHGFHIWTAVLAARRLRRRCLEPGADAGAPVPAASLPFVSIMVPVAHVDDSTPRCLETAFGIDHPHFELLFCVPGDDHPAIAIIAALMSKHPGIAARLLTGRGQFSFNPKLDNLDKAWPETLHSEWIIIADANIMMPPDLARQLFAVWRDDTGLTCSPPIGTQSMSLGSDIESAFLNTFHARMLYAADALGIAFAHGKAMLLRRSLLDAENGLRTLAFEVAEDSAATKLVRARGLSVRLVDRPFAQPLGRRTLADAWHRHLRWAQLRRQSFPVLFAGEILLTSAVPAVAAIVLAVEMGLSPVLACAASLALWLGVETALAWAASWPMRVTYPIGCLGRDLMVTAIWPLAWFRQRYRWRDNEVDMTTAPCGSRNGLDRAG